MDGTPADLIVGSGGRVSLRLPARSGQVWRVGVRRAVPRAADAAVTLDPLPAAPARGDFTVGGRARGVASLLLVADGELARAQRVQPAADGRWWARVDTGDMVDPAVPHSLSVWAEGLHAVSAPRSFRVQRAWQLRADVEDPAGDDRGPNGRYLYPTDPGGGAHRQMDLRRVRAWTAGGALQLQITVMPLQNATLPDDMRWHLRLRVGGWANALFAPEGASADNEGTPVAPAVQVKTDRSANTVTLTLPAAALRRMPTLSGARIYVTTWDYDGGYRALDAEPAPYAIGGCAADGPRIMDDSPVIVLP